MKGYVQEVIGLLMSAGMKQEQIAEHLGVRRVTVNRYHTGTQEPRPAVLARLVDLANAHVPRQTSPSTVCPVCQRLTYGPPQGYEFCGHCSNRLGVACPVCGSVNHALAKYCDQCAAPL